MVLQNNLLFICVFAGCLSFQAHGQTARPEFINFGQQLLCTGQIPFRYSRYGCWCGFGNAGERVVDAIDECCRIHDMCFLREMTRHGMTGILTLLGTPYSFRCENEVPQCNDDEGFARAICECDRAIALCTRRNSDVFTIKNIFLFSRTSRCTLEK